MTSWIVFIQLYPRQNVHLPLLTEINLVGEPNLGVFELPYGGVGIKPTPDRPDRVAPDNPPRRDPIKKRLT